MHRVAAQFLGALLATGLAVGRPFTNTEGKTIEAEIMGATTTTVTLKIPSGRNVKLNLNTLSGADQKFVKEWLINRVPRLRVTPNLVRSNKDDKEYYYENERQVQVLSMKVEVQNDDAKAPLSESELIYVLVGRSLADRNEYKILAAQKAGFNLARQEKKTIGFKTVRNLYSDGDYDRSGHKCIGYILYVKRKSDGQKVYSFGSTPVLEKAVFNIINLESGDITDENFLKPASEGEGNGGGDSGIIEVR